MMTAFANEETAREAVKLGAFNFIHKPFDNDLLKVIVQRAVQKIADEREKAALQVENEALIKGQRAKGQLGNIIGRSDRMQSVYQMIETVAQVQSTVLITGESGTGKELVARAIHDLSPRAQRPFVSVNCGAFTETLLESELFGYIKGSFTGATANRKGLFEAADPGTIFLDEIGEMSPAMQVKLLRVLQERKVRPVGAHEEMDINTRVIAATNRDLTAMTKDGIVPRKPLLSHLRHSDGAAAFARTRSGHLRTCRALHYEVLRAAGRKITIRWPGDAPARSLFLARQRART